MTKHRSSDKNRNSFPAPTSEGSAFSLKELKAKAEAVARMNKPKDKDENSGLIDLKSMMAKAEQERAASISVAPHLDVYPFGAPAAVVEKTASSRAHRRPKRGRAARIGIAAAVLGIAAVAAAAAAIGLGALEAPRPVLATPLPTALQWTIAPATMLPAAAAKEDLASAQPSQDEKESDPALATPRPPKEIPHIAKAPVLNRTDEAATPKTPSTAPPPPASDPCKGDLMCAMQRAVKK